MDAKLMVAVDGGDDKKLKGVLNKEDAVPMIELAETSERPSKEDQSPAGNIINPLLLMSARVGSGEALSILLEREDAKNPPMMLPTQDFLELLARGRSAQGRIAVSAARDVEEGVDHQPASLAAGALLKGITPDGDSVLHVVAGNGDGQNFLDYAGIIYDRDRGLLFEKNHRGDTPLHCAVQEGNFKMISHLIDLAGVEGAEMKLRLLRMENNLHETALHKAVRFDGGRILGQKERALLAAADPAGEEKNKDDTDGAPEEKDAADPAGEEKSIVKLLMGADPELANYPVEGISPLYLAILLGKSSIALTLYDKSGGNLSYSGAGGQNALHVSVLRDTVMVDFLLHWNKSLTTQVDNDGSTPLHFATSLCRKKVFRANPAALYQADKNGSFPIHVAANVGSIGAIQCFHDECPDSVKLRDGKGRTFFHVAVEKRRMSLVFYVCETPSLACLLNIQDNDGNTALHLAIHARSFRMFCALFGNMEVNLNLPNNNGETPCDISRSKLPRGLDYALNSEYKIFAALRSVGANHGALRCDKTEEKYSLDVRPEETDKESERLRNAAQALIIASVLIATVAFSATFALPGGYRADDHTNRGTPTLAGSYVFDAFMMATTLAFICSSMATIGFVFAATPMVNLFTRRVNFNISVLVLLSSVTSLSIAFALGVYMALSPVARSTAVAVCVITTAVLLSASMEYNVKFVIIARPLCIRKGLFRGMLRLLNMQLSMVAIGFWPFVVTFGWAGLARIHRHR